MNTITPGFLRAGPTDFAFFEEVSRNAMASYYAECGIEWKPEVFRAARETSENFIVCNGVDRVGFLCLSEQSGLLHLQDLQILPGFRSRGLGTACLAFVAGMASQRGLSGVMLRVFRNNPAAKLYLCSGFRQVGESTHFLEFRMDANPPESSDRHGEDTQPC